MDPTRKEWIEALTKKLGVVPKNEQTGPFWSDSRVIIVGGGEGGGKTLMGALWVFCNVEYDAFLNKWESPLLVWIVGADFEDTKKPMNDDAGDPCIARWCEQLGILDRNESSMPMRREQPTILRTTTNVTYMGVSGRDPTKIGRDQPDYIAGEEISRWEGEVYRRCYGRLSRKRHRTPPARGYFSGSFETSLGWFPEEWKKGRAPNQDDVASFEMPSWSNPIVYPGGRNDEAILQLERSMTEARFIERHAGRPVPPQDAVLPEFRSLLHVSPIALDPKLPTYVFIDPGDWVYAVLFVQMADGQARVVDEVYVNQWTHEQVVTEVSLRPAWKFVTEGVMDVAGKAASPGGFGSAHDAWKRDTGLHLKTKYLHVSDTVERLRSLLMVDPATQIPRLKIDPKCEGLLSELGSGTAKVPGGGLWRMRGGTPQRKNDHACKALGYGVSTLFGTLRPESNPSKPFQYKKPTSYLDTGEREKIEVPALSGGYWN